MNSIHTLKGKGIGRKCILFGGGVSTRELNKSKIPDEIDIISINLHATGWADMIIYYDAEIRDKIDAMDYRPAQIVIGHQHKDGSGKVIFDTCSRHCTHFYDYFDSAHGDTGFRALQFASEIFEYNVIYLAGYDYSHDNITYHANEEKSDKVAMERFLIYSVGVILPLYNNLQLKAQVFNLSPISKLTIYPYTDIFSRY